MTAAAAGTSARSYGIVTLAYWGQTITDGALHMLVLLHFYTLGFSPFQLAFLFVLYELAGVATNLLGGWIAARLGLGTTLYGGLVLQIVALALLALLDPAWPQAWSVAYAVLVQGLAGIAKDLTKMSSKSAIKVLLPEDAKGALFRWVAVLTGSKNAMKGLGFFLGGVLLAGPGFAGGLALLASCLVLVLALAALTLPRRLGSTAAKAPFRELLSKSAEINLLSAARFFLFGARDIWFVVGVPIFLYETAGWSFVQVSTYLALWVIGYGVVQAAAPSLVRGAGDGLRLEVQAARAWALGLTAVPLLLTAALAATAPASAITGHGAAIDPAAFSLDPGLVLAVGLGLFGAVFAVNSSLHSYLILAYSKAENVSLDVGFYYTANAGGRLAGCLLSGAAYGAFGIVGCLLGSAAFLALSFAIALQLPARLETQPAAARGGA